MKRLALLLLLVLIAFAGGLVANGLRRKSPQVAPGQPALVDIDSTAAAERLGAAIRIPTISWGDISKRDTGAFAALTEHLTSAFPAVTQRLTRETIGDYSLLYTWQGSNENLPPLILASHLDVVPAPPSESRPWTQPPFSGAIADGSIWGRGAIDDKSGVLGLLEATESLLAKGFTPERTIYLAFGHNEEGGGDSSGAAAIAEALGARGVKGATLIDEGGLIYDRVPGVTKHVAFIGITEKAILNIELRARGTGGHASMPPVETAVTILARAIERVQQQPMSPRFDGAALAMFQTLAPDMTLPMRTVFSNVWVTKPLVIRQLTSKPETNALVRTTLAPTMLEASPKENVLSPEARAVINARLLPGDTAESTLAHIRRAIDDERVSVTPLGSRTVTAIPVSSVTVPDFARLQAAIRAIYPDVLAAPFLTIAGTDARFYTAVAPNSYRFLPVYQDGLVETIHGVDEHIRIDAYVNAIRTYATIIRDLSAK